MRGGEREGKRESAGWGREGGKERERVGREREREKRGLLIMCVLARYMHGSKTIISTISSWCWKCHSQLYGNHASGPKEHTSWGSGKRCVG
jgi:hypothetical protein